MDIQNCSFCGIKIYPGHGSLFIKNNLKFYYFCRSKCRKLFHLKKNPLFFPWTLLNRQYRGIDLKEVIIEASFFRNFSENIRNYNNKIISNIIYEMKRVKKQNLKRNIDYKIFKKTKTKTVV
mmetsp:Transcript_24060/g.48586  ORF Transcript_24060/g.48586 Transcript_24060/m.48586 type:complete len:122 (-) Transcript_24060:319-684(-)